MFEIPAAFWDTSVQMNHPIALEPEIGGSLRSLNYTTMGWGYWNEQFIPGVDKWKFLEPRRITHVCNRWNWNHTTDLQAAFFNGDGFVSWENVWGIWNGMTPRDSAALSRISTLQRYFADFFVSTSWQPHFPVSAEGVYARYAATLCSSV